MTTKEPLLGPQEAERALGGMRTQHTDRRGTALRKHRNDLNRSLQR